MLVAKCYSLTFISFPTRLIQFILSRIMKFLHKRNSNRQNPWKQSRLPGEKGFCVVLEKPEESKHFWPCSSLLQLSYLPQQQPVFLCQKHLRIGCFLKKTSIVLGSGLTEILDTEEIDCVTTVSSPQHKLRSPFKESSIISAEILVRSLNCLLLISLENWLNRFYSCLFFWLELPK